SELQVLDVHRPVVLEIVDDEDERASVRARLLGVRGSRSGPARTTAHGCLLGHLAPPLELGAAVDRRTSVNVEPWSTLLASLMSPPSTFASRRQIARPRPVPPYCRVGELSTWRKSWKTAS